jgi:hypothetical protein
VQMGLLSTIRLAGLQKASSKFMALTMMRCLHQLIEWPLLDLFVL